MKTKMWKKILSLALALVMAATLLPEPAWAAVAHDAPEWGEAIAEAAESAVVRVRRVFASSGKMPSDTYSFLEIVDRGYSVDQYSTAWPTLYHYSREESTWYSDSTISYDKVSNTLTLNNYSGEEKFIAANRMGDLTINVIGTNTLDGIFGWGDRYGTSYRLIGNGTLNLTYNGLQISGELSDCAISIGDELTLTSQYAGGSAIFIGQSASASGITLPANIDGLRVETFRYYLTTTINDTSYRLYTKGDAYYGSFQVGETYSLFLLNKDGNTYTIANNDPVLSGVTEIPAEYEIYYSDYYRYKVVSEDGGDLNSVTISPSGTTVQGAPTIHTDAVLPNGFVGRPCATVLSATPYVENAALTWSLDSGSLPDGLTLNSDGTFSGTFAKAGTYTFSAVVNETDGGIAMRQFTFVVKETTIATTSLKTAAYGVSYSATLTATPSNNGALTWAVTAGSLPGGLSLSESGVISGTPTANGDSTFTVTATEEGGGIASKQFTLTVAEAKSVTYLLDGGTAGDNAAYEEAFSVASGAVIALPAAPTKSDEKGALTFAGWKVTSGGQAQGYTYNAGNAFTVNEDVTFTAQWEREMKADYTGQVIGWVGLYGVKGGNSTSLWGEYYDTVQPSVSATVPVWQMRDCEYDRLDLHATVDGEDTVIASYNNTVDQTTGTVTLTGANNYTVLNGVVVSGLARETDYYLSSVVHHTASAEAHRLFLYDSPILVSTGGTYTVELSGVKGSANYDKYDWSESKTGLLLDASGKLTVTPTPISATATVTGTVTVNGGTRSGVIVTATQIVGGVSRSVSATTEYENGTPRYTLHLIPNCAATFAASYQGQQLSVTSGAEMAGNNVADNAAHSITAISNTLTVTITPNTENMTNDEKALADSYLRSLVHKSYSWYGGENYITVTSGGKKKTAGISVRSASGTTADVSLDFIKTTDATLSVSANVPGLAAMSDNSVSLTNSRASVTFTPELTPGVYIESLRAERSADVFTVWYQNDSYKGKSERFTISTWDSAYSIPCPTGEAGTFKVVLLPASYDGAIEGLAYGDLPANAELTHWDVTLTAGKATQIASQTLSSAASENAAFVTKPGSTMTASAESFASENDLIAFTGRIGLDDGCKNGRLTALYANMGNSAHWEAVSANPKQLVIDGKSYAISSISSGSQVNGVYTLDLSDKDISLPCDYTLYCTPGNIAWEMDVSLSANVTYDGGGSFQQLIGRAVVEKPGAYITTLSTYVCDEQIAVEGTAKPNEAVTIYDNGAAVGTATADQYGDWAALIDLYGTDTKYVTTHRIHSVSAAGVMSDEMTVFHQPGGAQLTGFTMTYSSYGGGITSVNRTVNVGDTYIANHLGLSDVSFTATVKNPDQLTVLPEGFNCPVTVKVYTNDGQIRFVPATQTKTETVDGATIATFVADVGDVPALVSGAEAMMLPITKTIPDTTKFSLYADDMADMDGELAELLTALNDELSTNFEDAAAALTDVADKTSNDNVAVTFAADGTPTGAPSMPAEQLNDLKTCAKELGLKKATIEYDVSESTMEWLDTIGAELANQVGADGKYYEIQNLHASASTLEKAITDTKGRATELLDTGNLTVDGKNSRLAMYALSGDGYDVMFSFMSAEGMYLETVSASFTGEFEGFGRTFAVTPAQRRLFAEQGPASDAHLTATGYAALVLADAYADALYQRNLQEMESGDHGAVLNTFNKVVDQIAEDPAGNGSLYLGVLTSLTPEALWAQIVSQLAGVSVGASIGLSAVKDAFESAQKDWEQYEQMEVDLRELRNMPCYQVMNPTRKEICQDYYLKFSRASAAWTYITILVLIAFFLTSAASLGLAVGSFIPGFGLGSFALSLFTGLGAWALGSFGMNYAESWFTKTVDAYRNCYMKTAQFIRITAQEYEGDDCKEKKKYNDGINGKTSMGQTHDPSGVVYEGVLENPVEGATATLYYAADENGNLVTQSNSSSATQLLVADGVRGVTPGDPVQTTGENGIFQWFVPEGLWFVTAEKGALTGDSNGDTAATVNVNLSPATKLLPVLPPQLNVNIPLVDAAAPYVTEVRYTTDGIYVTFSKYMVDDQTGGSNYTASVLNPANYSVYSVSADTVVSVVSIEQGSTPANRGTVTTYTRTVKLTTNKPLTADSNVTLTVNNAKSYAGTQMASYASDGVVTIQQTLAAPTFSGATSAGAAFSGSTVKALMNRGGGLTITAETGTKIYYTTDGSIPTVDASGAPQGTAKLYTSPIAVSGSMTVRAIAVKIGYTASGVATAEITQRAVGTRSDGSPVSVDPTPAPAPTPTPSGTRDADPGSSSVTVPVSGGAGTVNLNVTVNGGTAQVAPISDADVARVVGTGGGNVNVVMDLSSLGGKIETVSIPDASFDKLSNALEAHNGSDSLTVKTANGSVKLSENAASAVADASNAGNVALTIKNSGESGLNAAQKAAVADKNVAGAYDLGVTANGRDVGVLGGGFTEVNVPFTPEAGASALDYRVYRVNENSNIALVPSAVHDGKLTVRSDRLDDLVVVYEPTSETFADVADDAYYADAVAWALANGITNGMGDNLFAPDDVCTRAQVVTFLWRAAGSPQPKNKASGFADVAADTWYSDAVAWAAENGITNGVGDNLFGVDEICTRAQVVTFLCRMSSGRVSGRNPFVDVKAGAYYYDAVLWAYANGVTNGTGDKTFSPVKNCTRAQIVTFLYRDFSK